VKARARSDQVAAIPARGDVRRRILDAALDIVEVDGIKALTQPKVARRAGVRQSHLTYYFPRRAQLVVALLQHAHDRAAAAGMPHGAAGQEEGDVLALLGNLMFDGRRMRFFIGIILEAGEDPELRSIVHDHARGLAAWVAPHFGRRPDDQAVIAFIDHLRGIGLRMLLEPALPSAARPDLRALAKAFGLRQAVGCPRSERPVVHHTKSR